MPEVMVVKKKAWGWVLKANRGIIGEKVVNYLITETVFNIN